MNDSDEARRDDPLGSHDSTIPDRLRPVRVMRYYGLMGVEAMASFRNAVRQSEDEARHQFPGDRWAPWEWDLGAMKPTAPLYRAAIMALGYVQRRVELEQAEGVLGVPHRSVEWGPPERLELLHHGHWSAWHRDTDHAPGRVLAWEWYPGPVSGNMFVGGALSVEGHAEPVDPIPNMLVVYEAHRLHTTGKVKCWAADMLAGHLILRGWATKIVP